MEFTVWQNSAKIVYVYAKKIHTARHAMRPEWSMPDLAKALAAKGVLGLGEERWLSRIKNYEYEKSKSIKEDVVAAIADVLGIERRWFDEPDDAPVRWKVMPSNVQRESVPYNVPTNLVPYWGLVPCGSWERPEVGDEDLIQVSERIEDIRGVIAVRVAGNSMLPMFRPNEVVSVRLGTTPLDGVVTLAQNQDGELTLKLMRYVDGVWELHSLNPAYGNASAEQWSIIGHAIYHEGGDLSGIRV